MLSARYISVIHCTTLCVYTGIISVLYRPKLLITYICVHVPRVIALRLLSVIVRYRHFFKTTLLKVKPTNLQTVNNLNG